MPFLSLTSEIACDVLASAGFRFTVEQVRVESREDLWLVRLPESRMAGSRIVWFAATPEGRRRLASERRVLRLLEQRCTFAAPRILFEDTDGEFDMRAMVPGLSDPARVFARVRADVELAKRVGTAVGAILAGQHARIHASDVAGRLPRQPEWPEPTEWIRERLASVITDPRLMESARTVMAKYDALEIPEEDRALVHTDVGFHNLAFDPESLQVLGIFDYKGAAWADRHHDFRYLVFDADRSELLDAAVAVYESALHRKIDKQRIFLYNAVCAISFLAYRAGKGPEERWCGRTLAEDLEWTRDAMARSSLHAGQ